MISASEGARRQLFQHLDFLRETLPQPGYALLLRVLCTAARQGGDSVRFHVAERERVHYTPVVRNETLWTWAMVTSAAHCDTGWLRQLADALDAAVAGMEEREVELRGIAVMSGLCKGMS